MSRFIGIDFSGSAPRWAARATRTNVWIAYLSDDERPRLTGLIPVQQLPGDGAPFDRLAAMLAKGDFDAAAIDAPFAVPSEYAPAGGWPALLALVGNLPHEKRPFPRGDALVQALMGPDGGQGRKSYRATEKHWIQQGVNVRSTLWNGPRGGSPFTVAALYLLARAARPVWPWQHGPGMLVEAFPAAQLRAWGLAHQGYNGDTAAAKKARAAIVVHLAGKVDLGAHVAAVRGNADALDALLCAFAARAAWNGTTPTPGVLASIEGEIAVEPG